MMIDTNDVFDLLDEMCPKCNVTQLKDPIEINALSRITRGTQQKIYVCSDCGVQEALEEFENGSSGSLLFEHPNRV